VGSRGLGISESHKERPSVVLIAIPLAVYNDHQERKLRAIAKKPLTKWSSCADKDGITIRLWAAPQEEQVTDG